MITLAFFAGCTGSTRIDPMAGSSGSEQPPKSVLLIVADTLRRDRMSIYGAARDTTPLLDARSDYIVRYDQAFAASNWTFPCTASILTGALPERNGIDFALDPIIGNDVSKLQVGTLVPHWKTAGRRTALFTGNRGLEYIGGLDEGFDDFEYVGPGNTRNSEVLVDRALQWLDESAEPFFLHLQPFDTHFPYTPPEEVLGTFRDPGTLPFDLTEEAQAEALSSYRSLDAAARAETLAALLDLYDEELLFLDRQIDRLLVGLEQRGWLDDTLVVLTADHGELFDDGGSELFQHGVTLRAGVTLVPLLVYASDVEGGRSDVVASGVDVLPSIFSMVGEPVPATADGGSFTAPTPRRAAYLWDAVGEGWDSDVPPMAAVTDGRWKVTRECPGVARGYDLATDPDEANAFDPDAKPETSALLAELVTKMAELHPECP